MADNREEGGGAGPQTTALTREESVAQQIEEAKRTTQFDVVIKEQLRLSGKPVSIESIRTEVDTRVVRAMGTSIRAETRRVQTLQVKGWRQFRRSQAVESAARNLVRTYRKDQGIEIKRSDERSEARALIVLLEEILRRVRM